MDRDSRRLLLASAGLASALVIAAFGMAALIIDVDALSVWLLLAGSIWCMLFMAFGVAQLGKVYGEEKRTEPASPEISEALTADPVHAMDTV